MNGPFHNDSQQGSCEEETYWIFDHEADLIVRSCSVLLKIAQVMNDPSKNELVEKDNSDKIGNNDGSSCRIYC